MLPRQHHARSKIRIETRHQRTKRILLSIIVKRLAEIKLPGRQQRRSYGKGTVDGVRVDGVETLAKLERNVAQSCGRRCQDGDGRTKMGVVVLFMITTFPI